MKEEKKKKHQERREKEEKIKTEEIRSNIKHEEKRRQGNETKETQKAKSKSRTNRRQIAKEKEATKTPIDHEVMCITVPGRSWGERWSVTDPFSLELPALVGTSDLKGDGV